MARLNAPEVDPARPYWSGWPFRVVLVHRPGAFLSDQVAAAVAVLDEFRAECHRAYFAFNGTVNGRFDASVTYGKLLRGRDRRFTVGTEFPDGEQRPGKSTIASLTVGELLDSLAEGGDFEDRQNRALVVMLYHRWDEWYRHRIGSALGLKKGRIRCSLMGEVRQLRNLIVHENGIVPESFNAPMLARIWNGIPVGYLAISDRMVHALMEQLNAIRVEAG
ncbi:MAG: hypothetical protein OXH15_16315 [Gammaproteobacteria bacterium]|nr:hypothetical protein [Gammaproteobacteria bacterium]